MCRSEGEGEEYLSEGEDGKPCIKWRKKKNVPGIKGKLERMEKEQKEHTHTQQTKRGRVPV